MVPTGMDVQFPDGSWMHADFRPGLPWMRPGTQAAMDVELSRCSNDPASLREFFERIAARYGQTLSVFTGRSRS